jgi:hypothetical protein
MEGSCSNILNCIMACGLCQCSVFFHIIPHHMHSKLASIIPRFLLKRLCGWENSFVYYCFYFITKLRDYKTTLASLYSRNCVNRRESTCRFYTANKVSLANITIIKNKNKKELLLLKSFRSKMIPSSIISSSIMFLAQHILSPTPRV